MGLHGGVALIFNLSTQSAVVKIKVRLVVAALHGRCNYYVTYVASTCIFHTFSVLHCTTIFTFCFLAL